MTWDLPIAVEIDGEMHPIRNKCDYRMVLDVICALNDIELTDDEKIKCALFIFYEDILPIDNYEVAVDEMMRIINYGNVEDTASGNSPQIMDWEHDFPQLAPPISRVLGYDVRTADKFCHWWSFLGAYMEIGGDCTFATVVSIRNKRAKGQKLEKWEEEFYREHIKMVELPQKLTAEEQELLNSEW